MSSGTTSRKFRSSIRQFFVSWMKFPVAARETPGRGTREILSSGHKVLARHGQHVQSGGVRSAFAWFGGELFSEAPRNLGSWLTERGIPLKNNRLPVRTAHKRQRESLQTTVDVRSQESVLSAPNPKAGRSGPSRRQEIGLAANRPVMVFYSRPDRFERTSPSNCSSNPGGRLQPQPLVWS
jgi:hypothetical protein